MILLIHHGDAVGPDIDPMRPLSDVGRARAAAVAAQAASRGVEPVEIWHSGKLRARQTAELFWRACNPFATLTAVRGLQPDDPPVWLRDRLVGESRSIAIVGHMPHLNRLLGALIEREVSASAFPLHGCVAVEPVGDAWEERWRVDPVR